MKRMYFLPVLLALSLIALVSIATAQSTYYPILEITSKQNNAWYFDTVGVGWSFSGKDVKTIVAQYMIYTVLNDPNSPMIWTPITPKDIHFTPHSVTLTFDSAVLPSYANGTMVSGTLANGETFLAAGPGFVWSAPH